ncbi:GNAT family N-acetyltransferase [Streptomyces rubellomurinus]|uniref:GNAT family N-acetyltransferase n=1 Tax=Streptomyces rubellomurinus (strain ATCC 31215) TaxID=359131 RepID=UPI0005F133BC|nr:GNAT family N-acetyltransferase [Streptomyces rubellomurinus]
MSDVRIRPLRDGDWDALVALEERAYAARGLSEGREALRSRHRASPDTCFALEHAGRLGGYLLALPYPPDRCPDLAAVERGAPHPSNLHVHDVVVAEELRGRGLGRRLLHHVHGTARAAGYRTVALVAVGGTEVLWASLGYRARPGIGLPESYGSRAVYMAMPLHRASPPPTDPFVGPVSRAEVG